MFILGDDINYNRHLSTPEKNLLRCLADHCGSKSICWPSVERIGAYMNVTVRTVQRYLRRVEELRLVEVIRRRGKTNLYKVVCLQERPLSTPPQVSCHPEQTIPSKPNVRNGLSQKTWKSPKEIQLLIADMGEVLGEAVAIRNRGWLWRLAQAVPEGWIYESLSWLKESMSMGGDVQAPCALLTWRLRAMGAAI